jgi:hypothetical protein
MKSTEAGYKNLMLGIHDLSTPDDHPPGKIAFRERDILSYSNKIKMVKEHKIKNKLRKSLSMEGLRDPLFDMNNSQTTCIDTESIMI